VRNTTGIPAGIFVFAVFATAAGQDDRVEYPNYRGWMHVKTTLIGPQNPCGAQKSCAAGFRSKF
jgi:hypothetical protein